MDRFLRKVGLKDTLITELQISKDDFVDKLKNIVDKGSTSSSTDIFDIFSRSKNEYKGSVNYNGFEIKKRRRLFDMNMNLAIAKGTYIQKNNILEIKTTINGFKGIMIPFYIFIIIFYLIFILTFFLADDIGNTTFFFVPFILIHGAFMLGLPYWFMLRSTKNMKRELEREFYYLTKD